MVKQVQNKQHKVDMTFAKWCRAFEIYVMVFVAEQASSKEDAIKKVGELMAYNNPTS